MMNPFPCPREGHAGRRLDVGSQIESASKRTRLYSAYFGRCAYFRTQDFKSLNRFSASFEVAFNHKNDKLFRI